MLLALIPWWGRVLAVFVLIVGCLGYGYVKGLDHQQNKDALQRAAEVMAANALAQKQAIATHEKVQAYEAEIQRLQAIPPTVVHDRVVSYVRGLCGAAGSSQKLSTGARAGTAAAPADAAVRPTEQISVDELQHDIMASEANKAQLVLCQSYVRANGGDRP